MRIIYLKTKGFRKFRNVFETNLYDVTSISGKNRSGKSNILYAIINIMLGTSLSGDEKTCLVNKNCDASYGELHFIDNNGEKHVLIRGKNRYSNKGNFIALDGKPVNQTELIDFYKDKKLFLSIINPLYFLSKKAAEQKEMVDKYLSNIKPKIIFDRLELNQQKELLKKYYSHKEKSFEQLTQKEQEDFINLNMFNICMNIAYNNLSKNEQELLEGIPSDIPKYISELNGDIKRAENCISLLDGKVEYAQNIANEKLEEYKKFEKDEELSLAEQELSYLNINEKIIDKENQRKVVEGLEKDILLKEKELNEIEQSMKAGKKKYIAIKNGELCTCPTCNQIIKDESKINTINKMHEELISMFNKRNLLETQIKDFSFNLSVERCKYHALDENTTVEKQKRITILEESIVKLKHEKQEIDKFNSDITMRENNIKRAKLDIDKFNNDKLTQIKFIDDLVQAKKVAQKLYISYLEEKMKLAKEYLKDVDIKFYSVLKTTGEIKEDFIITYKNTPLPDLSRSETIATALEFANMFNKISRANFPIFIDDYESCADYDFIDEYSKDTQIIVSKVEKGHLLKIADYRGDKATIIKTIVRGFTTLKNYKYEKIENTGLPQVA